MNYIPTITNHTQLWWVPNVVVAHQEEGIEAVHLASGRTICKVLMEVTDIMHQLTSSQNLLQDTDGVVYVKSPDLSDNLYIWPAFILILGGQNFFNDKRNHFVCANLMLRVYSIPFNLLKEFLLLRHFFSFP